MEVSRPVKVQILGEWIRVQYLDDVPDDDFVHGDYNDDKNLIRIRKQDPETMAKTLMHELGHALLTKSGWAEELGTRTEEAICRLLEMLSDVYWLRAGPKVRMKSFEGAD
jgi:hypothetical protein